MRAPPLCVLALFFISTVPALSLADEAGSGIPLWNGKDFSGWDKWLGKPPASVSIPGEKRDEKGEYLHSLGIDNDPLEVFTVVETDGRPAIRISGQVFGGITTKMEYSNYHLRLQFKWGEMRWPPRQDVRRDSGLLYLMHSPMDYSGRVWPRAIEFQIQEEDVGDLYAIGMEITVPARTLVMQPKRLEIYDPRGTPEVFLEQRPLGNRCARAENKERPRGQWNTLDLFLLGDRSVHVVNGTVVMRLTGAKRLDHGEPEPITQGKILLQSEGAEVFYRDVVMWPISVIPAKYAK